MRKLILIFIFCWFGIFSGFCQYWQSGRQIYTETLNHFVELYDSLYAKNTSNTLYFESLYNSDFTDAFPEKIANHKIVVLTQSEVEDLTKHQSISIFKMFPLYYESWKFRIGIGAYSVSKISRSERKKYDTKKKRKYGTWGGYGFEYDFDCDTQKFILTKSYVSSI